ncbi:hypothetical protein ACQCVB_17775 [Fictibacillus phosphorivorans]|uniref:hypothetical protein n=1 Tax=Fictibacillus phosphorivorans TaxID=1221500 RepID=UPI003CF1434A
MTGNHNGPIGQNKKEVVRVVFKTHSDENYYLLDEEVWTEYSNGERKDITTHKDLKKKYEDKLKNGEEIKAKHENNINKTAVLKEADVQVVFITNYLN